MTISIVTVVRNDCRVVLAMQSVSDQKWQSIEHIIVDGMSTDGTSEIIRQHAGSHCAVFREPDSGIYEALNKGIAYASGELLGILSANDVFAHSCVVERVANEMQNDSALDVVYGDICYVNQTGKKVREWKSGPYHPGRFRRSWTPAHPTFYTYRRNFEKYGNYRTDFKIASDVELMYRFLEVNRLKFKYIPEVMVKMSLGGVSTHGLSSTRTIFREVRQGILENGGCFNSLEYLFFKSLKARQLLARFHR